MLTRDVRRAEALFGARARYVESLAALAAATRIDAIVNLAGAPIIGLPWFAARRREIWRSRVDFTTALVRWIATLDRKPQVLVSGSAIGFYGDRGDEELTESSTQGNGFLAEVVAAWEAAASPAEAAGIRVAKLRTSLVLSRRGGALQRLLLPARLGLAGPVGSGRQWWSWVTLDDVVAEIAATDVTERG